MKNMNELTILIIGVIVVGAFLAGLTISNFLMLKEIEDEIRRKNLIDLLTEGEKKE